MATAQGGGLPLPASPAARSFPPPPGGPLAPGFMSLQRQHCYLCDLPRTPWALLLTDYSEPVCRGCVNYEGPHRVEAAIESARRLKQSLGAAATIADSRPASRLPGHLISLPVPVSGRDDGLRVPVARAGEGVRLAGAGRGGTATAMDLVVGGQRVPVPQPLSRANHHRGNEDPRATVTSATTVGSGLPPPPPRFPPPIPGFQLDTVGLSAASLPLALVRSGLGDLPAVINGKRSSDPAARSLLSPTCRPSDDIRTTVTTGRPETVSPTTAARSRMVVETLATLACSAPFDVRLKMDPSVVGRVLAFDAAKPGVAAASPGSDVEPLQLAMFVELPTGSGLVYGCCGESSPVGWQAAHVDGDTTPFRHLEYRVKPEVDEWRPLADLLPESVRCFRDPLDRSRLPAAGRPSLSLVDAAKAGAAALGYGWNAAAAAAAALHLPPFMRPFQLPGPLLPGAGRKRKAVPGVGDSLDPELAGSTTSTLHSRLDLAADGLAIKRRLWMQSQADALRLALAFPAAAAAAAAGASDGAGVTGDDGGLRLPPRRSNSSSPPSVRARHQRTTSSDETGINHHPPPAQSPGPDVSPTRPSSTNGEVVGSAGLKQDGGSPSPRCTLCRGRLEDTHFVQCPSVSEHKFCFPCSRDSIKQQLAAAATASTNGPPPPSEVYCPSGERCPLLPGVAGGVPWAFMASEIDTIIGSTGDLVTDDQLVSTTTTTTTTTTPASTTVAATTTTSGGKDLKIKKERDS